MKGSTLIEARVSLQLSEALRDYHAKNAKARDYRDYVGDLLEAGLRYVGAVDRLPR